MNSRHIRHTPPAYAAFLPSTLRRGRHSTENTLILIFVAAFYSLALNASAQQISPPVGQSPLTDNRGFIDVWQLRDDVMKIEPFEASDNTDSCYFEGDPEAPPPSQKEISRLAEEEKVCVRKIQEAFARYQALRESFNAKWQTVLREAIRLGDPVAEVIWRQCDTTPVLDRSALASTCDNAPERRKEAALRLRQIGFEAAFDEQAEENTPTWSLNPSSSQRALIQMSTLRQMEAGVFGGWPNDAIPDGNGPRSPEELINLKRAEVIKAASAMVRRCFTHHKSHNRLRLNRKPIGTPTLEWSANMPAQDGFRVYLQYEDMREIIVGGNRDAQYLRMLYETLTRSEQRIDEWLKSDSRWSVFLLHRRGRHEWIPEGMESPFGRLDSTWQGAWTLHKRFVNFKPVLNQATTQLKIQTSNAQTIAQFEETGMPSYTCELRYSGATSMYPEDGSHAKTATHTALGYLPELAPISPQDAGPTEPFAPMNPRKVYRQVLVQCPQGEWPDNRNQRFLFLADDSLIEVLRAEDSRDLVIRHWHRESPLAANAQLNPMVLPFDIKPTLAKLAQAAAAAERGDAQLKQVRAKSASADADELIASLTQLRLEKPFYSPSKDFPDNLSRLIDIPGISTKLCATYRKNPSDPLQRFNFMVILNTRANKGLLTPDELAVVPDCLRLALNDRDARVRLEAVGAFAHFAEEKDRSKLLELRNDPNEYVRLFTENALNRLEPHKGQ